MIEEVKDFFGDVKEGVGNKGFLVLVFGAVAFFLYNLLKEEDSGEVLYTPTGISGYPSVEKNADVVIDTVTQNMEGYYSEMLNVMADGNNEINQNIADGTNTLLDAISGSETTILGSINDSYSGIMDSIGESTDRITETVEGAKDELTENMGLGFDSVHLGFETVENYINESMSRVEDLSNKIDNIDTTPRVEYVTEYVEVEKDGTISQKELQAILSTANKEAQKAIDEAKKSSSTGTNVTNTNNTYTYKTKSGLNTSTSIVDALKATGEDSSMSNRKKIAEANGISNYTGTYSQNVSLLNKLKAGELIKPSGSSANETKVINRTLSTTGKANGETSIKEIVTVKANGKTVTVDPYLFSVN